MRVFGQGLVQDSSYASVGSTRSRGSPVRFMLYFHIFIMVSGLYQIFGVQYMCILLSPYTLIHVILPVILISSIAVLVAMWVIYYHYEVKENYKRSKTSIEIPLPTINPISSSNTNSNTSSREKGVPNPPLPLPNGSAFPIFSTPTYLDSEHLSFTSEPKIPPWSL